MLDSSLNRSITWFVRLPSPMRKLSGFMSRWIKLFECTYSIREICGAGQQRVFIRITCEKALYSSSDLPAGLQA